ncbi:basic form of pathogenesis-related protein 1-like [Cucurbita moschata]|uniref:Basic form of pathogenesis-related protein 1-like n=2 Tax=Cucurbita TaxID=3660 RepID=A0A6J1EJ50_CUCMO
MASPNILKAICLLGIALTLSTITPTMANSSPKDFVDAHNAIRAEVGIEPLKWNETMATYAQKYAESKIATCEMAHSGGPYGENLAVGYEGITAETAVKLWADEKKHYNHASNSCGNDPTHCVHYRQLVWKNTTSIGCAQVTCQNSWIFVICCYYPSADSIKQRPY